MGTSAYDENVKSAKALAYAGVALILIGLFCLLIPGGSIGLALFGLAGIVLICAGGVLWSAADEQRRRSAR